MIRLNYKYIYELIQSYSNCCNKDSNTDQHPVNVFAHQQLCSNNTSNKPRRRTAARSSSTLQPSAGYTARSLWSAPADSQQVVLMMWLTVSSWFRARHWRCFLSSSQNPHCVQAAFNFLVGFRLKEPSWMILEESNAGKASWTHLVSCTVQMNTVSMNGTVILLSAPCTEAFLCFLSPGGKRDLL